MCIYIYAYFFVAVGEPMPPRAPPPPHLLLGENPPAPAKFRRPGRVRSRRSPPGPGSSSSAASSDTGGTGSQHCLPTSQDEACDLDYILDADVSLLDSMYDGIVAASGGMDDGKGGGMKGGMGDVPLRRNLLGSRTSSPGLICAIPGPKAPPIGQHPEYEASQSRSRSRSQ